MIDEWGKHADAEEHPNSTRSAERMKKTIFVGMVLLRFEVWET